MRRPAPNSEMPDMLALFPLSRALLLPGTHRPLNIFEPRFVTMIDDALAGNRMIGLIQPRETDEEAPRGQVPLEQRRRELEHARDIVEAVARIVARQQSIDVDVHG